MVSLLLVGIVVGLSVRRIEVGGFAVLGRVVVVAARPRMDDGVMLTGRRTWGSESVKGDGDS